MPFRSLCQRLLVFTLPINTISTRYTYWLIDDSKAASGLCPVRRRQAASLHFGCVQNTTAPVGLLNPSQSRKGFPALLTVLNKIGYQPSVNQLFPATVKPPVSEVNGGVKSLLSSNLGLA
jgi:hypothetical protein